MLVIGSEAVKYHFPEFRTPKDQDAFSPYPIEGWETFWHPAFDRVKAFNDGDSIMASVDELYTIKISHSYWELPNNSWTKHMEDAMFLKSKGAKLIEELHTTLYKVWEETHGKKKVSLQMNSEEFFTDAVKRKYDHDSLHRSVAYGDRPMYEYVLKDGAEVDIDMSKVRALRFEDQVKLFKEEVFATALERIVVPKNYKCSPKAAYAWALRRTVTSLTKGWSARFMAENYDVFRSPGCDYVARHKDKADQLILLEA